MSILPRRSLSTRQLRPRAILGGVVVGAILACSAPEPAVEEQATEASLPESISRVDLVIEPLPELFFDIKAQATGARPVDGTFTEGVAAWAPVTAEIGTFGGFWRFDLAGMLSKDFSEFREWFADLPESLPSRAGGTIPIQGPGYQIADAMEAGWDGFLTNEWQQRLEHLSAVRQQLNAEFMPRHRQALHHMLEGLGIADPELEVPVYLVTHAHPPGATTYRTREGAAVVLSTEALLLNDQMSDLQETILHEVVHTLDLASDGKTDAFSALRRLLEEAGLPERDPRLHDVPHLLMFTQAEETMRRLFNPNHSAYGDSTRGEIAPLYERSGPIAEVVRMQWRGYLDGDISRDEALAAIVRSAVGE